MLDQYSLNHYEAVLAQIRKLMKEKELTQSDLGKALGITQSSVSALLKGESQLSVAQLMVLANFLGTRIHQILTDAESSLVENVKMTPAIEAVVYRSEPHLLAYAASTQPINAKNLAVGGITQTQAQSALNDLVSTGVLKKEKDKYVQGDPSRTYVAQNRFKSSDCHRRVVNHSWKMWNDRITNDAYRKKRFNFFLLERFTTVQIKELETILWSAYEKAMYFQKENMARKYALSEDEMSFWNIHCMLMTPLEDQ